MTDLERVRDFDLIEDFIMTRATTEDWNGPDEASPLEALNRLQDAWGAHEKEDAARSLAQLKILKQSEAELAALRKDYEEKADFFNRAYKLLDEKDDELATLREAVRAYMDNKDSGREPYLWQDLRQLIKEKP